MSTRPSRPKACVEGAEEAAPGWSAALPPREDPPPEPTPPASLLPFQASCVQYRLVVRDANTLQIRQLYTCLDQIQHIEWSADSLFILCALYKRGLVQVCGPRLGRPPYRSVAPAKGLVLCPAGLEEEAAQLKGRFLLKL